MTDPVTTLKIELRHEVRNQRTDIEKVEERLLSAVNHPTKRANAAAIELHPDLSAELEHTDSALDTRIAVGHRASGLFLELKGNKRFAQRDIERIVRHVESSLNHDYADNVQAKGWTVQATEKGRYV